MYKANVAFGRKGKLAILVNFLIYGGYFNNVNGYEEYFEIDCTFKELKIQIIKLSIRIGSVVKTKPHSPASIVRS